MIDATDINDNLKLVVTARRDLTVDIVEFTLKNVIDAPLPEFAPGAHVALKTPCGAMRQYSLINEYAGQGTYVIAIKKEANSRGGSISMHEDAQIGTELEADRPDNNFEFRNAQNYLLIAGGIGVTPMLAMANHLSDQDKKFQIIYCARSSDNAAYLEEMRGRFGAKLKTHFDDGDPDKAYDFWDHFAEIDNKYVYCCGPKAMMDEIKNISGHWPDERINFENFNPVEAVRLTDNPFEIELAKSGKLITVKAEQTILDALRSAGFETKSSCESGTCGTCKQNLIAGEVDHRDMVLMDEEKANKIMLCVSRSKGGKLTIDL